MRSRLVVVVAVMMLSGCFSGAAPRDSGGRAHALSFVTDFRARPHSSGHAAVGELAAGGPNSWALAVYSSQNETEPVLKTFGDREPVALDWSPSGDRLLVATAPPASLVSETRLEWIAPGGETLQVIDLNPPVDLRGGVAVLSEGVAVASVVPLDTSRSPRQIASIDLESGEVSMLEGRMGERPVRTSFGVVYLAGFEVVALDIHAQSFRTLATSGLRVQSIVGPVGDQVAVIAFEEVTGENRGIYLTSEGSAAMLAPWAPSDFVLASTSDGSDVLLGIVLVRGATQYMVIPIPSVLP